MSASSRGSDPGVVLFDGNDSAYFAWLARNPMGYVVNVRRTCSPDYVVLHRASCGLISNARAEGAYTERSFSKLCGPTLADIQDAPKYCGRERGVVYEEVCTLSSIAVRAVCGILPAPVGKEPAHGCPDSAESVYEPGKRAPHQLHRSIGVVLYAYVDTRNTSLLPCPRPERGATAKVTDDV